MATTRATRRHRTAAEWAKLVREWKRSGLSATTFAGSTGVGVHRLRWWKWHFAQSTATVGRKPERLELVRVDVEPRDEPASASPRWEMVSPRGSVRVHQALAGDELRALVGAFLAEGGAR